MLLANILIVISAVIGMFLIADKNKLGFIVFLITEASLTYIGYDSGNYGLIATAFVYLNMNIYSYIKWTKYDNKRAA